MVKSKSLSLDYEYEVRYEKIRTVVSRERRDLGWLWVAFVVAGMTGLIGELLLPALGISHSNPSLSLAEKAALVVAYILVIPAFRKFEWFSFRDADGNYLATVIVDRRSKRQLIEAIDLIKQKAGTLQEFYISDPFPSTPPLFHFNEFNLPDFLKTSTVGFYEDRLIAVEESLAEEMVDVIEYDELGGRTQVARMGNDKWDYVWSYWLMLVSITVATAVVFFWKQVCGNHLFATGSIAAMALLIPMFFLRYIKSEILIFYDKRDQGVFWVRINSSNREELKRIVTFMEGKKGLS